MSRDVLSQFHAPVREWFKTSFEAPTAAQRKSWPEIVRGNSTLLLAPTGSGKTLSAFLAALDGIMFSEDPPPKERLRVLYISPLKALGVDIERNLAAPIVGISNVAERLGHPFRVPLVSVRSGDTPARERQQFHRHPPDILITTPESLYLLLTSEARERLRFVDTVIVDEIHSVVATKRGAHLFLSLERLETLREQAGRTSPLQRIGLSATQRPLEVIARLLGGFVAPNQPRPVSIVDAGSKRAFDITVEVPVEDMARLRDAAPVGPDGKSTSPSPGSIWPSIHPRLVELIRSHRSTMIFVNSRRLAERLASALNELAEEELALAHHGSIAKESRLLIEDRLKSGTLPAIVATSSLELGIDMGAVDLVIQIEAPPSVASGMQRIGRSGHVIGAVSTGVVFPKFRGDLLACAAAATQMREGHVEETLYPQNPLDVLAQQIVAIVSDSPMHIDALYDLVRRSATFAELARGSFEGVLDMLSGRYPSDEFAELRARVTWDRVTGTLTARQGAKRIAIVNAGTIPDRGLYGVFLADGGKENTSRRVGELDEEMVFEARAGEVFILGASSWRIEEITHDRVLVTPAPGEPGKMPFWHGDRPGRPVEFGRLIGALARKLASGDTAKHLKSLKLDSGLNDNAANNLIAFVREQAEVTGEVPSERTLVVERFTDEVGDFRVCILSPLGARVHAPWALAAAAQFRERTGSTVDIVWSDDGIVFRVPEADEPPDPELFFPPADEVEELLTRDLGGTALFAARFRENAARALLLPRRYPGKRTPLWAQRKRSADLLSVASRFGSFPILLETYRECLRDVFDLPALRDTLRQVERRQIRLHTVDTLTASPFASQLLFSFVANFIYDGDAPLAEKRAQALSIDHAQLRELLGEAELRELLDPEAIEAVALQLQRLGDRGARHADGLHDLLLGIGDLSRAQLDQRVVLPDDSRTDSIDDWLTQLIGARRIVAIPIARETRFIAAEDAGRFRDALGIVPPPGLPATFLEPTKGAMVELCSRFARTHGPFTSQDIADRFSVGVAPIEQALNELIRRERVVEGGFLPGKHSVEFCDVEVLRMIKRRSIAKLRREVEPVEPSALARFSVQWHDIIRPGTRGRYGLDGILSVVEQLQGAPIPASVLLGEVLPSRIRNFSPTQVDELCSAGEIVWRGIESLGQSDGRISLYLTDQFALLAPSPQPVEGALARDLLSLLRDRGASFFADLSATTGAFPADILRALWDLVWAGQISNDTLAPMRAILPKASKDRAPSRRNGRTYRSRRVGPPGSEGRWSLLPGRPDAITDTARANALAQVLLERHGVITREAVMAENISGGFSSVYPIFKALEDSGKLRRGYFVEGLGATQFARPGIEGRLRALRHASDDVGSPPQDLNAHTVILAATDPANPYGAALRWPTLEPRPMRAAGAQVILHRGHLVAFIGRGEKSLTILLPEAEPERSETATAIASALGALVDEGRRKGLLIAKVNGEDPRGALLSTSFTAAGFTPSGEGWLKRLPGHYAHR